MSIVLPNVPKEATVKARLIDFGATLTPQLGGPAQYVGRLGARFAVDVQLPTLTQAGAAAWIARRLKSKATAQTLRLAWPQPAFTAAIGAPVVDGGAAAGTGLPVRGLTAGVTIPEGAFFSFIANGRSYLHATTDAAVADGAGKATLAIAPMLRRTPADGTAVEFAAPLIEGFLDGNTVEWDLTRLMWIGASFIRRASARFGAFLCGLLVAQAALAQTVQAPAGFVPQQAVAYGAAGSAATPVTAGNPLPVNQAATQAPIAPGTATASASQLIGCVFNSTFPTFTNGQQGALSCTSRGGLIVSPPTNAAGLSVDVIASQGDGVTNSTNQLAVSDLLRGFNASSWDRLRTIQGAFSSPSAGILATAVAGSSFSNLTANATTTVKSGAGILHKICVNAKGASANTATIYDSVTASGTKIGTLDTTASVGCIAYDVNFANGLTIVTATGTAADLTVGYR